MQAERAGNDLLIAYAARELSLGSRSPEFDDRPVPSLCSAGVVDLETAHLVLREIEARWRAESMTWVTISFVQARERALLLAQTRRAVDHR